MVNQCTKFEVSTLRSYEWQWTHPTVGGGPGRISRRSLALESLGVLFVILRLAVLVEQRLVTDGHSNGLPLLLI